MVFLVIFNLVFGILAFWFAYLFYNVYASKLVEEVDFVIEKIDGCNLTLKNKNDENDVRVIIESSYKKVGEDISICFYKFRNYTFTFKNEGERELVKSRLFKTASFAVSASISGTFLLCKIMGVLWIVYFI